MKKKLFLLDAFALIYRAHFAFIKNPRINSKGLNTSAILGFTNSLLEVINNHNPSHLVVAFDPPGGSNREETFSDYKANRQEMPEDIRNAIPYIQELIEAMNITSVVVPGYEADDLIGTLAKEAEKNGFETYMMTPDKDFGQLVSENIFIYKPGRGGSPSEILGPKEVCDKFEINDPIQVIDILGLWGDAVDNIPGVPGVGEKTAKKFIGQYGSIENLLVNTNDLKGKQKENVENFADQALLSKQLATIILDSPVDFIEEDFKLIKPDEKKLIPLLRELEFNQLGKRILGYSIEEEKQMSLFGDASELKDDTPLLSHIENTPHDYKLVNSFEEHEKLVELLDSQKEVAFDTETTSLDVDEAELLGISFCFEKNKAFYATFPHSKKDIKPYISLYKNFFSSSCLKIAHNIKYDQAILKNYNLDIIGPVYDTMIAHYLIDPEQRHNLDRLANNLLNYNPIKIESLIGKKGVNQLNMKDVDLEKIKDYGAEDADVTFQLYHILNKKIKKLNLEKLLHEIELPLTSVLLDMENEGITLDMNALNLFSIELNKSIDELIANIKKEADADFNLDSPKQLGEVIFGKLELDPKAKKTKTGQFKTDESTLLKLKGKHDIIENILSYRKQKKLLSTYVDALPKLISKRTNRIHTNYMQAVTATGRLSSNKPNLQNIPIRSEMGREIRKAFCPRDSNHLLLAADYSQIELRIIAGLSKDESMINAFKNNRDIHSETASKIFNTSFNDVSREMRNKAKMVNFGIIYGISPFGLSQRLNIKRTEAKEIIDNYFNQYPLVRNYMDNNIVFAKEKGYVETIFQRKRFLPNINSGNATMRGFDERNAINAPIQGSAADIIKLAMIKIHKEMSSLNLKSKLLLQVHDELVFDMHKEEKEKLMQIVEDCMMNAIDFPVPLRVELGIGTNWLDAH
ncbi:MAG: DNA polymerase I [Flavobacteriales bacterium]|nr:DNA polymerase I [Flavobacteriales bacterium]